VQIPNTIIRSRLEILKNRNRVLPTPKIYFQRGGVSVIVIQVKLKIDVKDLSEGDVRADSFLL
jgi:hypothetical protein